MSDCITQQIVYWVDKDKIDKRDKTGEPAVGYSGGSMGGDGGDRPPLDWGQKNS